MTILVTGAAGFIGSHFCQFLANQNEHQIIAIDNLSRGKIQTIDNLIKTNKVRFIERDLKNYDDLFLDVKDSKIDLIVHFASIVGGIKVYQDNPYKVFRDNTLIDSNVFSLCNEIKCNQLFYASSSHIYKESSKPVSENGKMESKISYGAAKMFGEIALKYLKEQNKDFNYSIARYIGIYGPGQDTNPETSSVIPMLCGRANLGQDLVLKTSGDEFRSYCYINDAIDATWKMILNSKNKSIVYNVGKTEKVKIIDIARKITSISNKSLKIVKGKEKTITKIQWCDCSLIKEELGWEAQISLENGLAMTYNSIANE